LKTIHKINLSLLAFLFCTCTYFSGCSSSGEKIDSDNPEKAFEIAKKKFDRGDYVNAIEDFSLIQVMFPGTEVIEKAQFYIAESYYYQKEYILADYEYTKFLEDKPSISPLYPDAMYKLGLTYYQLSPKYSLDQQYSKLAIDQLLKYIQQFPNDKHVGDADLKIKELKNKLAYKDFVIAENYMKIDNNRSAALYFKSVYEDYIESDWADDAMLGHAEALINGKKYDDAKKVLDKFYKLFPKSELKSKANRLSDRIKENQANMK
jgi:outer membrane protein assembly factor BamD